MSALLKAATCCRAPEAEALAGSGLLNAAFNLCTVSSHSKLPSLMPRSALRLCSFSLLSFRTNSVSLYTPLDCFSWSTVGCARSSASARCLSSP